jgi:cysteine-rich repeat protein
MRHHRLFLLVLTGLIGLGCNEAESLPAEAAGVGLIVRYDADLQLDQLKLQAFLENGLLNEGTLPEAGRSLGNDEATARLLFSGDLDGQSILIRVDGLSDDAVAGSVAGQVQLAKNKWTPLVLTLGDPAILADGVIHSTAEECDDGNYQSGDGCDENAFVEDGFSCSGEPSQCTTSPVDAGPPSTDAGPGDGGPLDAGPADAGPPDAGPSPGIDAGDGGEKEDAPDSGVDGGPGQDAAVAVVADAGLDGGSQPVVDAGLDSGAAMGFDAGPDSGIDSGGPPGQDAGIDAGLPPGVDAGQDSGPGCVPGCDGDEQVFCSGGSESARINCVTAAGVCGGGFCNSGSGQCDADSSRDDNATCNTTNFCCSGTCVASDATHCGTCGNTCGGGGSQCTPTCIDGECIEEGAVIFTEYIADPSGTDSENEWLELYNTTGVTIPLTGWVLKDDGSDSLALPAMSIDSGEYLLLARDKTSMQQNCSIMADEEWGPGSAFQITNVEDELALEALGCVIDHVSYADGDIAGLESRQLRNDQMDHVANDDGANWCTGSATFSCGSGMNALTNLGTPGQPNDCPDAGP